VKVIEGIKQGHDNTCHSIDTYATGNITNRSNGQLSLPGMVRPENTKEGSITVPLTSCLTVLETAV
jgi:hypothetical protein